MGGNDARTFELSWERSGGHGRMAMIVRERERRILRRRFGVLHLRRRRSYMVLPRRCDLFGRRPCRRSPGAAIEAGAGRVVDDHRLAVDVGDLRIAEIASKLPHDKMKPLEDYVRQLREESERCI